MKLNMKFFFDYIGEFEMIGKLKFGDHIRETFTNRFKNIEAFEIFLNLLLLIMIRKIVFLIVIFLN